MNRYKEFEDKLLEINNDNNLSWVEVRSAWTKIYKVDFRDFLFDEYNVTDNPNAQLLFDKAWVEGHSNGFSEVEYYFSELVELIK